MSTATKYNAKANKALEQCDKKTEPWSARKALKILEQCVKEAAEENFNTKVKIRPSWRMPHPANKVFDVATQRIVEILKALKALGFQCQCEVNNYFDGFTEAIIEIKWKNSCLSGSCTPQIR